MKKIKKPAERARKNKNFHESLFSISLLLSSYKQKCPYQNTKPQLLYCPDGLMVKLSVSQAVPICMHGFKPRLGKLFFFFQTFFLLQVHTS